MEYIPRTYDDFEDRRPTDQELTDRVHAGEDAAFNELWPRHQGAVEAIARRQGAGWHDSQDLAQEAAIKVLLDFRRNEREVSGKGTRNLAGKIVTNHTIDEHRKRLRRPDEVLVDEFSDGIGSAAPSAESIVVQAHNREQVVRTLQSALDDLPAGFAEAFLATNGDEESRQAYAEQTGIKIGTIASRNSRAKAKLAQRDDLRKAFKLLD